ncbi:MAG: nucleoside-diphosphate kinase, partial [Aquiluna sp.]
MKRNLVGEIVARCERKGYTIADMKFVEPSREL